MIGTPFLLTVGSISRDYVLQCDRLPSPGETLIARSFHKFTGGKGANQAVAAALLGASSAFIGRVGNDEEGLVLIRSLKDYGVNTEGLLLTENSPSGVALIEVDGAGRNSIVISPGANAALAPSDLEPFRPLFRAASFVLLQMEIPVETVVHAIRIAKEEGTKVILDSAPVPSTGLPFPCFEVDILTPNQTEAQLLTGLPTATREEATEAAQTLCARGAKQVLIKMAEQGALLLLKGKSPVYFDACSVNPIDSTAAGDVFTAALAVRLAEGESLEESIRFACAAGAIATTKLGAMSSIPRRSDVERLLTEAPLYPHTPLNPTKSDHLF